MDVSLKRIQALVDNPQAVDKSESRWIIPSTFHSRVFKEQEKNGEYWPLWADLDASPPPLDELAACIDELDCSYEIYTSRSATEDNQKSRIRHHLGGPWPQKHGAKIV